MILRGFVVFTATLASEPSFADEQQQPAPEPLVVAAPDNRKPYSFRDATGQPRGVLIDMWQRIGEEVGIVVEFELSDFVSSMETVRNGTTPVHAGIVSSDVADDEFLLSDPFMRTKTPLFSRRGQGRNHIGHLGDEVVGVTADSYDARFLERHFPNVGLRHFTSDHELLEHAVLGDIDHFVADYPTGHYGLLMVQALARFEAEEVLFTEAVHAAIAPSRPDLLAMVNEGLANLSPADRDTIRARWMVPSEPHAPWLAPALAATVGLAIALAVALHYLMLRRAVARTRAELAATVAMLVSANAELDRRANVDPLTKLANRYRFVEVAEHECARARRSGRPVTLVMIDVDAFKSINDGHGHLAGDEALRGLAEALTASVRTVDLAARLGGDEFVLLLPETDAREAARVVARVQRLLALAPAVTGKNPVHVRISVGVATYEPPQTLEAWIAKADSRLYENKRLEAVDAD